MLERHRKMASDSTAEAVQLPPFLTPRPAASIGYSRSGVAAAYLPRATAPLLWGAFPDADADAAGGGSPYCRGLATARCRSNYATDGSGDAANGANESDERGASASVGVIKKVVG